MEEIKTLDLYDIVKVNDENLIKILSKEVSFYRNLKKVINSLNKIG
jgi:5'(3')-deoxyribonucleotidase